MDRTIKTYEDLLLERERLQNLLAVQKQRVMEDWSGFKEEIAPVRNAFNVIGKITTPGKSNPLVDIGLNLASDVVLKKFLLAKAGWITRLAVPFVVKNYSSHLLEDKGNVFFAKLKNIFRRRKRTAQEESDDVTVQQENT